MTNAATTTATTDLPRWKCWWLAARPRTLTASLVPIVVGLSIAPPRSPADLGIALATIVSALGIQVGVNFANDCFDAEAGIDTAARLGPTRAVQAGLVTPAEMKRAFALVLAVAVAFGIPLVLRGGVPILAVGLVSMVCAWAYAGGPKPLASLGLGDAFVFVFFGVVPVMGTVWLQRGGSGLFHRVALPAAVGDAFHMATGHAFPASMGDATRAAMGDAFLASIPVALLAVAILVVNNLRDIPTDAAAGKRTMAVRLGDAATRRQYAVCVGAAMLWPLLLAPRLGAGVLVALLAIPVARRAVADVFQRQGGALNASLGETARLQLIHGVLLAAGIAASSCFR